MRKGLVAIIILLMAAVAAIAIPQFINYQGILRDKSSGDLKDGTFSMVFKIFSAETNGTEEYNSGATNVLVSNGLYNVQLPANASIFDGSDRFLEIAVEGDTLSPRLEINSVAYVVMAASAEVATTAQTAVTAQTATSATSADTADFATLSGTATNAGTVNDISANSVATADQLLALDSNKQFKGMSVSAEAGVNPFALFIAGKLGASVCVGTSQIPGGNTTNNVIVTNEAVTANSLIFLTLGHAGGGAQNAFDLAIKIYEVTPGSNEFRVQTMDNTNAIAAIPFCYLIIN